MPTAVFAANDRMAAGVLQGLKDKGISVPSDMSVLGYDDSDIATIVEPQLTTVRIPFFSMGKRCAVEFTDSLKEKQDRNMNIFIKPELIIRASTVEYKKQGGSL